MKIKQWMCIVVALLLTFAAHASLADDPLPSWNDGAIKTKIISFVESVTDVNSNGYVAPEDRIATFDNDGTLWVEQPMYTQIVFALDRVKELAPQHPEWAEKPLIQAILKGHYNSLSLHDIEQVIGMTHSGMSVDAFKDIEKTWLETARDRRFNRPYTDLIYQPMLEVINYLRKNNFKIYIVSGGGQAFMRAFAPQTYGIPVENIIGTAGKTKFVYRDNQPKLIKTADVLFVDDKSGKPDAINLFIGKKPIIAFGNSNGDKEMLEWTQSNDKNHLMLLVHHDDARREYAYGKDSKVGTFSDYLMQFAQENKWLVISMKNDWKVIFPFEVRPTPAVTNKPLQEINLPSQTHVVPYGTQPSQPPIRKKMRAKRKQHIETSSYDASTDYNINY